MADGNIDGQVEYVHLDLDKLKETALKGVRRTAVFLGLGLNASAREDFQDYELWKLAPRDADGSITGFTYGLVPDNAPAEIIKEYKEEFSFWLINNGLRELVEHFALFLDQAHHICLLCLRSQFENPRQLQQGFEHHSGLGWKLTKLHERFGIEFANRSLLETLYSARNCLSHRLGIVVEAKDCEADGQFHLKWIGMDVTMRFDSGYEMPIEKVMGTPLKEGGSMMFNFSERDISFAPGQVIQLTHKQITEMCFFVIQSTEAFMTSLIDFAKGIGIEVNVKPPLGNKAVES